MLYPFAVTLLSINKFLCVCVSVRNSDIAGVPGLTAPHG